MTTEQHKVFTFEFDDEDESVHEPSDDGKDTECNKGVNGVFVFDSSDDDEYVEQIPKQDFESLGVGNSSQTFQYQNYHSEDRQTLNESELSSISYTQKKSSESSVGEEEFTEAPLKDSGNEIFRKSENTRNQSSNKQSSVGSGKENNLFSGLEIKNKSSNKIEYICEKKALKVTNLRTFLSYSLEDYKVRAIIRRINQGIFNQNVKYQVFIEENNRFMLSIQRDGLLTYIFSMSKENISSKNRNYLGMMTTNVFGTQFMLFDSGFKMNQTRSLEHSQKQLASIKYQSGKQPRKFQAIVSTNQNGVYTLQNDRDTFQELWDSKKRANLSKLFSQPPEYDSEDGNYKLDFKGLVKKPSVKNFILGGKEWDDSLLFGRIDQDTFIMEIKQPLSLLQASAICVSSIHFKLK